MAFFLLLLGAVMFVLLFLLYFSQRYWRIEKGIVLSWEQVLTTTISVKTGPGISLHDVTERLREVLEVNMAFIPFRVHLLLLLGLAFHVQVLSLPLSLAIVVVFVAVALLIEAFETCE